MAAFSLFSRLRFESGRQTSAEKAASASFSSIHIIPPNLFDTRSHRGIFVPKDGKFDAAINMSSLHCPGQPIPIPFRLLIPPCILTITDTVRKIVSIISSSLILDESILVSMTSIRFPSFKTPTPIYLKKKNTCLNKNHFK